MWFWHLLTVGNDHPVRLVTLCPHTMLLHYYWPYSLCCVLHPMVYLICKDLYHLIPFTLPPLPSPLAPTRSFSVSWVYFHFVLFYFLDSPCKWDKQYLSFSVWFISFSITPSASVSHSVMSDSLWPLDCISIHGILQARITGAFPFSRGPFRPRDWTQVSCVEGRFFTVWVTREAPNTL